MVRALEEPEADGPISRRFSAQARQGAAPRPRRDEIRQA